MVELVDLYVAVLSETAILSLGVALAAWKQRAASRAWPVVTLMLGVSLWSGSEAVLWSRTSLEQQDLWLRFTYPGPSVILVGFLAFAFGIAGLETWLTRRRMLLVSAPLAAVCVMAMANPGGLVCSGYAALRIGSHIHYAAHNGPLYWAYVSVTYGMFLAGALLAARAHVQATAAKRTRTMIVLVGALFPFAVSALNLLSPAPVEGIESAAFFVTGLMFLFALIRGQLLDPSGRKVSAQDVTEAQRREAELQTANRDLKEKLEATGLYQTLTELTPDLVFVIDGSVHVVLANSAAARFLGHAPDQLKGARVAELFGPMGALFEDRLSRVAATGRPLDFEDCVPFGEAEIWLQTFLAPLDQGHGLVLGVSRDVTDSKRREVPCQSESQAPPSTCATFAAARSGTLRSERCDWLGGWGSGDSHQRPL